MVLKTHHPPCSPPNLPRRPNTPRTRMFCSAGMHLYMTLTTSLRAGMRLIVRNGLD